MTFPQPHPRVLCISQDPALRETRRLILTTRYEAGCVSRGEEMEELPIAPRVDVILLCHSLSVPESARAVEIGRRRWPGVKVIAVALEGEAYLEESDQVVRGLDGPGRLLDAIDRLVCAGGGLHGSDQFAGLNDQGLQAPGRG